MTDPQEAEELTLEKAIGRTGGALEECETCLAAILNRLGFAPVEPEKERVGQDKGESVLLDRIDDVRILEKVGRSILGDLRRVEHELRHL